MATLRIASQAMTLTLVATPASAAPAAAFFCAAHVDSARPMTTSATTSFTPSLALLGGSSLSIEATPARIRPVSTWTRAPQRIPGMIRRS